jgi:hypothetical protein
MIAGIWHATTTVSPVLSAAVEWMKKEAASSVSKVIY